MIDKIITFILEHFFLFLILYLISAFLIIEKNDLYHPESENAISSYIEEKRTLVLNNLKTSLEDVIKKNSIDIINEKAQ